MTAPSSPATIEHRKRVLRHLEAQEREIMFLGKTFSQKQIQSKGRAYDSDVRKLKIEIDLLRSQRADMLLALKAVEEWWLSEGKDHFTGAPYAIFATRVAIAKDMTEAA